MKISEKLKQQSSRKILAVLEMISSISDKLSLQTYLVGGIVRDILLSIENFDIDIVVENKIEDNSRFNKNDAIEKIIRTIAKELNAKYKLYPKFMTGTIFLPDSSKIDIATSRKEIYKKSGDLPTVSASDIFSDQFRRDFSINSLLMSLNKKSFGKIIDNYKGFEDLKQKTIRIMHDKSFDDDPTRIFRAFRFEQRFDFTIEKHTEKLIYQALEKNILSKISSQRIMNEMILIFNEKKPLKVLKRLNEFGVLQMIHPKLKFNAKLISEIQSTINILSDDLSREKMIYQFTPTISCIF